MVISVINLKGGVGKTTTTFFLGHMLPGSRLLVDATSETNLTRIYCPEHIDTPRNILALIHGYSSPQEIIYHHDVADIIPGTRQLGDLEKALGGSRKPEMVFVNTLMPVFNKYDWTVIDCPPHMGIVFRASLLASDAVIIPVNMDHQAIQDGADCIDTIQSMRDSRTFGQDMNIKNIYILPTMKSPWSMRHRQEYSELRRRFSEHTIMHPIRLDMKIYDSLKYKIIIPGAGCNDYKKTIGGIK
jgi:chromosome partitioning protein